jgi:hypothetical protein
MLKCEACLTGMFSTSCTVTCIFTHTNCKLCNLWIRLQFSHHFQGILTENPDLPNNLLMSDMADFHLHGIVNNKNFWYWSDANPHKLHQHPLYNPKFTVWSRGVNGPYFLEDEDGKANTVTSQCYTEMINECLVPKLPPKHNMWFQQNGATAHTAVISMAVLHFCFRSG